MVKLTLPQLEGAMGRPRTRISGKGYSRGVFSIQVVIFTLLRLEAAKARPRTHNWRGCCRGVFAIRVVTAPLSQLEGNKARPRTQNWGDAVGVFMQCEW